MSTNTPQIPVPRIDESIKKCQTGRGSPSSKYTHKKRARPHWTLMKFTICVHTQIALHYDAVAKFHIYTSLSFNFFLVPALSVTTLRKFLCPYLHNPASQPGEQDSTQANPQDAANHSAPLHHPPTSNLRHRNLQQPIQHRRLLAPYKRNHRTRTLAGCDSLRHIPLLRALRDSPRTRPLRLLLPALNLQDPHKSRTHRRLRI